MTEANQANAVDYVKNRTRLLRGVNPRRGQRPNLHKMGCCIVGALQAFCHVCTFAILHQAEIFISAGFVERVFISYVCFS